jgi:hypothetical protein
MLAIMLLSEKDKEALVIDMLNKYHSVREIAKQTMPHLPKSRKLETN